jgi:hypothetical protein
MAAQLADVPWPFMLLAHEQVRIDRAIRRSRRSISSAILVALAAVCSSWDWRSAWRRHFVRDRGVPTVVAALVMSHWLLDVIAHRPATAYPNGPEVRAWVVDYLPATVAVEEALFGAGVYLHSLDARARRRRPLVVGPSGVSGGYFANPPPARRLSARATWARRGSSLSCWSWWTINIGNRLRNCVERPAG